MDISELFKMIGNPALLQQQFKETQERLSGLTVTGTAGGNMATVTLNGKMEMLSVSLAKEVFDSGDIAIAQDLFKAAYNDAQAKLREAMKGEVSSKFPNMPEGFNTDMFNNFFK